MSLKKKVDEQLKQICKTAVEVISQEELSSKLQKSLLRSEPLRVKAGFDPTASDIHLGHVVLLKKLRTFQDLGHLVIFIVGDFTARIGDPSGRDQTRPPLSRKEIVNNAKTYTDQAFKILERKRTKVVFNSKWFDAMSLNDITELLKNYTVARLLERDDFSQRIKENKPITMLEFFYPLMQGFDSVRVKADIELGGTDQKFNLLVGRRLQECFNQDPQVVMTLPLLVGLDGNNKMSKSLGNYIGIKEQPSEIFGKTMSLSDELMYHYYQILTDKDVDKIKREEHPKESKLNLACEFISQFYDKSAALKERQRFESIFSRKETAEQEFPVFQVKRRQNILDILSDSNMTSSNNEARRLIGQRAVEFNGQKISDVKAVIDKEGVLKVGKKKFLKLVMHDYTE